MMRTRPVLLALFVVGCIAVSAVPLGAYLKLGARVGERLIALRWTRQPIQYFVTNRDVAGVSAPDLRVATERAFGTWNAAPRATIQAEFAGFVNTDPFIEDGASVIGFRSRPDLERTLGATTFSVDRVTGDVIESDIFLNSSFTWSIAAQGESGRFDVESIMLHEVGHLLGLAHSALGETDLIEPGRRRVTAKGAVMFPIAYGPGSIQDRALQPDDVAGVEELYGGAAFSRELGSIGGRVTRNGFGVFGAHVVAFNPNTGAMVASFSLGDDGEFVISGLEPGFYLVRTEPLDDAEIESFFESDHDVDVNFAPAYFPDLVVVPAGGSGPRIDIRVGAR